MRPKITRYKLRTCIRKDTYQYSFEEKYFSEVQACLTNKYGPMGKWGSFPIGLFETESFIIRLMLNSSVLTLIRKSRFNSQTEQEFHQLIGYNRETD